MSRTLVERYWRAQDPYDAATLAELRHAGWSSDWPQSKERIPSHEADVAINTAYADYPAHELTRLAGTDEAWRPTPAALLFMPIRITGASDFWIGEARLEYPEQGLWYAVALIELREGLVWHDTVYYCRAQDVGPEPSPYPDPLPSPLPGIGASMEHLDEAERRHRDAYERYAALVAEDPATATSTLFHPTAVADRPQLGRRATGVAAITRAHIAQRDALPPGVRRVMASGHVLVVESIVGPASTGQYRLDILEFADDKVVKATEYVAESTPAPEWRRELVEPTA